MKQPLLKTISLRLILLTICLTHPVSASTYDDGFEALQANQQKTALDIWKPLAERGHVDAQFGMGVLYSSDGDIEQNSKLAVDWFKKAAEQGHAGAQFNLGNEYKRGAGLSQDDSQAAYWWKKAAQKGLLQAQYNLGMAYYFGSGVKQDRNKARFWFKMAADNRYEPALNLVKRLQEESKQTPAGVTKPKSRPKQTTSKSRRLIFREKWIQKQPKHHYTIQLFGSGNEEQVEQYINKHQLTGSVAYFYSKRDDKPWYSVIYGSFPDAETARSAVISQGGLFQNSPWVRQFKGIQAGIRNTH